MTAAQVVPYQQQQTGLVSGGAVQAIVPQTYADVARMAQAVAQAGIAPKFKNEPARVASVMMCGMELGLKPMSALRLFYMLPDGQPALTARGMLAVVQGKGLLTHWEDRFEGEGDDYRAVIVYQRRGFSRSTRSFSIGDAKAAKLITKDLYSKYLDRMLWNRAASYALNDSFADLLGGLYDPSELGGPVIDEAGQVMAPPVEAIAEIPPPPPTPPKPPLQVQLAHGEIVEFSRNLKGLREALDFLASSVVDGVPETVSLNDKMLGMIAEKMPDWSGEVDALRKAAKEALQPSEDAEDPLDPEAEMLEADPA